MKRVYVAGPYTKGDVAINVRMAMSAADELLRAGFCPYLPHLTHFWHLVYPHDYLDWLKFDAEWLKVCDAVIRLPGESNGADKECTLAAELNIPVWTLERFLSENKP